MKRISLGLILFSSLCNACPTCVGNIEHDSPAFFRDEFYVPTDQEAKNDTSDRTENPQKTDTEEDA